MYLHAMHEKVNKLMSYNAILNFIIDNRNSGKSTQFKKRAFKRALKNHTLCVWCRRHKDEIKECKNEFLNSKFFAVIKQDYGDKYKKEDFKIKGNYAYYKKTPFVYFCAVSKAKADKGIDAENIDTIVYDEFMTDDKKYNYYHGNEVKDFFTIFMTKKRKHADGSESHVYIYMLGNRDSFTNPFYTYFNLPVIELSFEGVKTFKNGSIAVMQLNTPVIEEKTDYDKKLKSLFKNTPFDAYLNGGNIDAVDMDFYTAPKNAVFYAQFDLGYNITFAFKNAKLYAFKRVDKHKIVFTDKPKDIYKRCYVLQHRDRTLFKTLEKAYKLNNIRYENQFVYHNAMKIIEYLTIL